MPSLHKIVVPVLGSVVRAGDASIIQSSRFGQAVLAELEAMQRDCTADETRRLLDGGRLPDAAPISFPVLGPPDSDELTEPRESSESSESSDLVRLADAATMQEPARCQDDGRSAGDEAAGEDDARASLEQRIDALIDHHVSALRHDLITLIGSR